MFIPLKMVLIGIDPYPYLTVTLQPKLESEDLNFELLQTSQNGGLQGHKWTRLE